MNKRSPRRLGGLAAWLFVTAASTVGATAMGAEVVVRVRVPDSTPPGDTIHIAGDFQGWNPGDPAFALEPVGAFEHEITLDLGDRQRIEYKFTRGSWARVEKGSKGEEIRNRVLEVDGDQELELVVHRWADMSADGRDVRATMHERVIGTIERHDRFASECVAARNVDVWLPPDYESDPDARYPVLYMHDGQNLFDPGQSFIGVDWGIDETMTRLVAEGAVRPTIVVGVWNTSKRYEEYMPAVPGAAADSRATGISHMTQEALLSDAYLRFLVTELKPFIDDRYRTLTDRANTFVMGSSMGGLISAYAMCEYPEVFGGAGCVSTHWPAGDGVVIGYLAEHMPDPATHRIYFDYGTETLDAQYGVSQRKVDENLEKAGYRQGENWLTREFPGDEHSERAWRRRVHVPLRFLLGN